MTEKAPPEDSSVSLEGLLNSVPKDELRDLLDRVHAESSGISLEEYRAQMALNDSLHEEGAAYCGLAPSRWPPLTFCWDFSREGQRFGLDGVNSQQFQALYPEGLRLGYMPLGTFDRHLAHFSRRDTPEELWTLGSEFKLAKTIAYIRRGFPITPPVAASAGKEVILRGGHHRYAIAKAVHLETIPFLVTPDEVEVLESFLEVTWGAPRLGMSGARRALAEPKQGP